MDYQAIAKILKNERCDRHKLKATLVPLNDTIKMTCCCDSFKEKLLKQIEKESKRHNKELKKELHSEISFQATTA